MSGPARGVGKRRDLHVVWVNIVPDLLAVPTAERAISLIIGIGQKCNSADHNVLEDFSGWRPR
jgi:phosphonate dehydrogenase